MTHPATEPDVSRAADDVSRAPINGVDSDGPTPDDHTTTDHADQTDHATTDHTDNGTSDTADTSDTGATPISGEPADGPPVDDNGVPLNFLGNRQGEHPFAEMGDYVPMGGDRSNGMGSYDQRVAPLIGDHDPWGVHGSRDEFNQHHRPDGTYRTNQWPDNDGAVRGSERDVTLPEGTVLDRFGGEGGRFLSPMGTDGQPYHYRERAIFPDNAEVGYHVYVVSDPDGLPGTLADVAPALGQPGGGRQFTLPDDVNVQRLIDEGVIREVRVPPADGRVLPDSFGEDRGDGSQNTDTVSVDDAHDGDAGDGTQQDSDAGPPDTAPLPDHLQPIADGSSFQTPAGAALYDPADTRTRNAAAAVTPIDGHFVMDVHSDGRHAIVNGQRLGGSDLAAMARHLGWNGTDPIILNGCEAGRHPDGLAADLARESGARVIAPTERSWSGEHNRTPYSSSADHVDDRGRARPTIPPDGGWRAYDPDGTVTDTGRDGLPIDNRPTPTSPTETDTVETPSGTPTDKTATPQGAPEDGPQPTSTEPAPDNRTDSPTEVSPGNRTDSPGDTRTGTPADSPANTGTDAPADTRPDTPTEAGADTPTDSPADVGTDAPTDSSAPHGTPGDGPPPSEPLSFQDDVDRGRIQAPFTPPTVNNPDDPVTIRVDDAAAGSADPSDPHRPLHNGERLIGRDGLTPNTAYEVPGRGTYYTNDDGVITHADLEAPNERDGIKASGADVNPDASYPEPNTTYRVTVDGAAHTYATDAFGLPPRYQEWSPPPHTASETFPVSRADVPADSPLARPLAPGEALSDRDGWPPHTRIVHNTPNGQTTLYTGPADPDTGTARVMAIDTHSSPSGLAADRNPELNNFPPNTITRIDGQHVYLTNDLGITAEATDQRDYSLTAPRSSWSQDLVAARGGPGTDGGHIDPTQGGGAPDARNQFPQDSTENRPQRGVSSRETWYGQDMEAAREQRRGTDILWHDFQSEGAHPVPHEARPTEYHSRFVMRTASGTIRIHFRRFDN